MRRQITPAERAAAIKVGLDPDRCNWCDYLLDDDPEPQKATWRICSYCLTLEAGNGRDPRPARPAWVASAYAKRRKGGKTCPLSQTVGMD